MQDGLHVLEGKRICVFKNCHQDIFVHNNFIFSQFSFLKCQKHGMGRNDAAAAIKFRKTLLICFLRNFSHDTDKYVSYAYTCSGASISSFSFIYSFILRFTRYPNPFSYSVLTSACRPGVSKSFQKSLYAWSHFCIHTTSGQPPMHFILQFSGGNRYHERFCPSPALCHSTVGCGFSKGCLCFDQMDAV